MKSKLNLIIGVVALALLVWGGITYMPRILPEAFYRLNGMQYYENRDYGFSFAYPKDWVSTDEFDAWPSAEQGGGFESSDRSRVIGWKVYRLGAMTAGYGDNCRVVTYDPERKQWKAEVSTSTYFYMPDDCHSREPKIIYLDSNALSGSGAPAYTAPVAIDPKDYYLQLSADYGLEITVIERADLGSLEGLEGRFKPILDSIRIGN